MTALLHQLLAVCTLADHEEGDLGPLSQVKGGLEHGFESMRHAERAGVEDYKTAAQSQILPHSLASLSSGERFRIKAKVIGRPVSDQSDLLRGHAYGDQGATLPFTVDHNTVRVAIEEVGESSYGTVQ
jgi:hypothetical protein